MTWDSTRFLQYWTDPVFIDKHCVFIYEQLEVLLEMFWSGSGSATVWTYPSQSRSNRSACFLRSQTPSPPYCRGGDPPPASRRRRSGRRSEAGWPWPYREADGTTLISKHNIGTEGRASSGELSPPFRAQSARWWGARSRPPGWRRTGWRGCGTSGYGWCWRTWGEAARRHPHPQVWWRGSEDTHDNTAKVTRVMVRQKMEMEQPTYPMVVSATWWPVVSCTDRHNSHHIISWFHHVHYGFMLRYWVLKLICICEHSEFFTHSFPLYGLWEAAFAPERPKILQESSKIPRANARPATVSKFVLCPINQRTTEMFMSLHMCMLVVSRLLFLEVGLFWGFGLIRH